MKYICEMTKSDFNTIGFLDYFANALADKILNSDELVDIIKENIDVFCFDELDYLNINTEIKVDGLSVEDFLEKNKNEIWETFKRDYPEMVKKEITNAECCFNCTQFGNADLKMGYCFLRKEKVKPTQYCEEGSFKE